MKVMAERVIAYLKADSTLTTLLGSADNIFASNLPEGDKRKDKYVTVPADLGEDGNNIPMQSGDFTVEVAVSRKIPKAFSVCMEIAGRVDDLLNKGEAGISTASWKIIHLLRVGSPTKGPMVDKEAGEVYMGLEYEFILDESTS